MSNIKKIIGVVLALVMALSVTTIAFAAEGDYYSVTITPSVLELNPGDTATVEVTITANYNVSAMSIPVFFDKNKVTVSEGQAKITGAEIVTDTTEGADVSAIYEGAGKSQADYGLIALEYIAKYGSTITKYEAETIAMTFTVTANAGASGTSYLECVGAKKTTNPSGSLYIAKNSSTSGTVDSLGEVIDDARLTGATINIAGAAQPADLELTATGEAAGVVIDVNKTFGGQYDGAVYGFLRPAANTFLNNKYLIDNLQATNGGALEFARPNGKTSGGFGTGSLVKVNNSDGTLSKTYVVVIFGDVDQNGLINLTDASKIKTWYQKKNPPADNSVLKMAANTALVRNAGVLHNIQLNDATAVKNFYNNNPKATTDAAKLNPVNLAAAHYSFNTYYQ